ncbi:MAG: DNA alkylation repair protein [Candidatus Improbicoccus pseudotrichonymphae]|uniref:DNA alkylation repair protein n=1 Tax=Candidatus Improbicoccus pseudotrichonymphae TaxID=3033792 RepID=A0AA48I258_9FIRM|nr:MAG: DNA alkylation repair protein [Candidatus Improbicoccus pseudotrichonymphae]
MKLTKYEKFIDYLQFFTDLKHKKFSSKVVNDTTIEFIGVKMPILRKLAKQISKNDYEDFLKFSGHKYFEERAIHGLIIGYAKLDLDKLFKMLKDFVPYISNWALCDLVARKYCQFTENQDFAFKEVIKFTYSENSWEVRLGLVLLLNNFVNERFVDKILEICKSVRSKNCGLKKGKKSQDYYVKMGNSWLISQCYVKFPKVTEQFLKSKSLDKWTQNKAIQKIKESLRANKKDKLRIESLKIK